MTMMWWYGPGMSGWGYALMTVSMVLFWALVIFGVVALVRYLGRDERGGSTPRSPEEVLAERFARGEIDEDQYKHSRETLAGRSRPLATHSSADPPR
jgi:putative membrane protein